MGVRQDLTDYRVAIKRRYNIPESLKQKMVGAIEKILDDPLSNKREIVSASKVILAAEQQNQADERLLNDNERILEFAERMGLREEVERATERSAGCVSGFVNEPSRQCRIPDPSRQTERSAEE